MRGFLARLLSEAGETMVETLCAVLVVTLSLTFLAQAVLSAARANAALDAQDVAFVRGEGDAAGEATLTVAGSSPVRVDVYETGDGYVYYDPK